MDRLFVLFELVLLGFGVADPVREPSAVGGKDGGCGEGDRFVGRIGNPGNAEFVVAVGADNLVGEPFAVRGEFPRGSAASAGGQGFPFAVFGWCWGELGLLCLGVQTRGEKRREDLGGPGSQHIYWMIAFAWCSSAEAELQWDRVQFGKAWVIVKGLGV